MSDNHAKIYDLSTIDRSILSNKTIAVIGYGNQGRAQAMNLRENQFHVLIGNQGDIYRQLAISDGFETHDIPSAVTQADVVMLLIPDEIMPSVFQEQVKPYLKKNSTLVFASGYNVAFNQIDLPDNIDILLLAPRMIGVGVRERFLSNEGFYCFVDVYQDVSGKALKILLALARGIAGISKPAIEVTFKQEAVLDLFNEQAFGPAFGRVLLDSINVLLDHGLPPEAVLVEMYMSEEMSYTYKKMATTGLVKQTLFHSQTSQYGAMSRGMRFLNLGLRKRMENIYQDIDSGSFAREWSKPATRVKFRAIKFFAMRQRINRVESAVRKALGMKVEDIYKEPSDINEVLNNPAIKAELESFKDGFEY